MLLAPAAVLAASLAAAPARPRAVVLISVDSLRADLLGAYGSTRAASPALDALARESVAFEEAWSQAPNSLPSHASVMTSLHPRSHAAIGADGRIAAGVETVAERFRAAGWRTAAFTGGFSVQGAFGLSRGFEVYADSIARAGLESSVAAASAWLAGVGPNESFFLFVHGYDLHPPWTAPASALARFAPAGEPPVPAGVVDLAWLDRLCGSRLHESPPCRGEARDLGPRLGDWLAAWEAGALAHADAQIGRLLAALDRAGPRGRAAVVVLSDHGQLLAQHLFVTASPRGELFAETLRVPLLVRAPGVAPRRVRGPVQLVDVAPTLLELAGLPPLPGAQGRSLAPELAGRDAPPRATVSEAPRRFGRPCAGLRERGLLLVRCPGRRDELFDAAADPRFRRDLSRERPAEAASLAAELDAWERRTPERAPAPPDEALEAARGVIRSFPWVRREADPEALRRWYERAERD